MNFRILTRITIAAVLLVLFSICAFAKDDVSIIDGNKATIGKLAPRFKITTIDDEVFNLDDLRGKKPIVISFWASWCAPCKKEMPYLQKFYDAHKDTCDVIAISIDSQKQRKQMLNTVDELKMTFPVALDYTKKLDKIYPKRTIPYLVVIDKSGKVVLLQKGIEKPEALMKELEDLLGDDLKPTKAEAAPVKKVEETK